mgnify:CR=1 FL=1
MFRASFVYNSWVNLIFGHKDLLQRNHSPLSVLVHEKVFDLDNAEIYEPIMKTSISEELDKTKQSAQSYLDSAFDSYITKTTESFRSSIHDSNLAIKRRYDELLSDVLDISDRFGKGAEFEKTPRYQFINVSLGIFIPTLIKDYVVDPRNGLEHEFTACTEQEALKAYEIARLFIDYTSRYLNGSLIRELEVGFKKNPFQLDTGFDVRFGENTSKQTLKRFLFVYKENGADTGDYFLMDSRHQEYLNLVLALSIEKELDSQNLKNIFSRI